jgi:hypothetical protein
MVSVFEQPLGTNYVRQPRFHCIIYIIYNVCNSCEYASYLNVINPNDRTVQDALGSNPAQGIVLSCVFTTVYHPSLRRIQPTPKILRLVSILIYVPYS